MFKNPAARKTGTDKTVHRNVITKERQKRIMKRIITLILTVVIMATCLVGCSEAEKVNYNISKQAQYFECERRITVYNARTDTIIFVAEGYMNIANNDTHELVVTFKTGANEYKKNYVYLNEWTIPQGFRSCRGNLCGD